MPTRITIACEHCGSKLTLGDDSKLGKKIKCPKCSEVFVATAADEDSDELDDDDDVEEKRPVRKAGAGAAAKGKKGTAGKGKGNKSGGNLGLIIGGAVGVGVLLIAGLVGLLFATGVLGAAKADPNQITVSPATNGVIGKLLQEPAAPPPAAEPAAGPTTKTEPIDQKWLPAKPEGIVRLRVADLWQSPLVKALATGPQVEQFLAEMKNFGGLEPAMIDTVTVAVHGAQDWLVSTKLANDTDSSTKPSVSPPVLVILTLNTPFDLAALAQKPPFAKYTHNLNHMYAQYEWQPNMPEPPTFYQPDPLTVLISNPEGIKQAIDAGPSSATRPELAFLDGSQHVLVAGLTTPLDPQLLSQAEQSQLELPAYVAQQRQYAEKLHGGSFGLKITGGIQAVTLISCKTPAAAAEMKSLVEAGTMMAQAEYRSQKGTLPPFLTEMADFLVGSLQTTAQSQIIQVSTNIPDSAQEKLTQLPTMLFMMAATSGMMPSGAGMNPLSLLMGNSPGAGMGQDGFSPNGDAGAVPGMAKPFIAQLEDAPENVQLEGLILDFSSGEAGDASTQEKRKLFLVLSTRWTGPQEECLMAAAGGLTLGSGQTESGEEFALNFMDSVGTRVNGEMKTVALHEFGDAQVHVGNVEFEISQAEIGPLNSVTGKITLVTGKSVKVVRVENFPEQLGKAPTDPELKAAGFSIRRMKGENTDGERMIVSVKKGYLLSVPQIVDADDQAIAFTKSGENEREHIVELNEDDQSRDDMSIKTTIYTDLDEQVIPFTFERIDLPKPVEP